jgi:hypothetical protein
MVALGSTFIPSVKRRRMFMPATAVDLSIILMNRFTIFLTDKAPCSSNNELLKRLELL